MLQIVQKIHDLEADLIGIVFLGHMPGPAKKNETHLLHALALSEENEREHLARQIHSVNTLLSVVKINLKKASRHAGNKEMLGQLAKDNYEILEDSMRTISAAVRELSPPMFATIGYVAAMGEMCRKSNATSDHKITWEANTETIDISPHRGLQLYRLSKEILQFYMHEAGARNIHVRLQDKKKKYQLRIEHDGKEMQVCHTKQYSIRVRAALAETQLRCGKKWVEIQIAYDKKN